MPPNDECPRFSIVVPSYNYAHTLRRCLDSVAEQDAVNDDVPAWFELIVVDDGSTDDTRVIARQAFADLFEPLGVRCVYRHQENAGLAVARNTGLDLCRGEWVWFLDADDELRSNAFATIAATINREGGDLAMAFGGFESITPQPNGRPKVRPKPANATTGDPATDFGRYLDRKLLGLTPGTAVVRSDVAKRIRFAPQCVRSQDIVFFGHVLATGRAASAPGEAGIVLLAHRHADSLRLNPDRMRQAEPFVVNCLFDPQKLPAEHMARRSKFAGRYGVDVATNYYRAACWRDSVRAYWSAVKADPRQILRRRPLFRFLRAGARALLGR